MSASKWACSFVEIVEARLVCVSEAPKFDVEGAHLDDVQNKGLIILMKAGEAAMHEDGRRCADAYC